MDPIDNSGMRSQVIHARAADLILQAGGRALELEDRRCSPMMFIALLSHPRGRARFSNDAIVLITHLIAYRKR
ncbi:hypothetical protein C6571_19160 (plasmid) [Simplicispira suum]|uniref:Uncharacterized protein n=1 Tax=Simplicispira suum TaxID=2109915 RepID=A0A2S0N5Y6_9BURK|nr:hypothetical protein C6571_19160 [Simplicispira suum]